MIIIIGTGRKISKQNQPSIDYLDCVPFWDSNTFARNFHSHFRFRFYLIPSFAQISSVGSNVGSDLAASAYLCCQMQICYLLISSLASIALCYVKKTHTSKILFIRANLRIGFVFFFTSCL